MASREGLGLGLEGPGLGLGTYGLGLGLEGPGLGLRVLALTTSLAIACCTSPNNNIKY